MDTRAGKVLAVVVVILVLLGVVAGVVSATREAPQLPAGTPEATVQDYVTKVYAGDLDGAAALLDPAGSCTVTDLEAAYTDGSMRVVLVDSRVDGDRATVRVALVRSSSTPFADGYRQEESFRLERAGDGWAISGEPWPMFGCVKEPPR